MRVGSNSPTILKKGLTAPPRLLPPRPAGMLWPMPRAVRPNRHARGAARASLAALALFATQPARASLPPPATGHVSAVYAGLRAGLKVLDVTVDFTIRPEGYHANVAFRTAGMFRMFVRADSDTVVDGRYTDTGVQPLRLESHGILRSEKRDALIVYNGTTPQLQVMSPDPALERGPVPPDQRVGTIDNISAMALAMRLAAGGQCAGEARVFDGRRLALVSATMGGNVTMDERRSIYQGPALRCDFTSRQLAGFVKSQDEAKLRQPKPGAIWFARVLPNAPPLPVRFDFENGGGTVSLYLTQISGGALESAGPAKP